MREGPKKLNDPNSALGGSCYCSFNWQPNSLISTEHQKELSAGINLVCESIGAAFRFEVFACSYMHWKWLSTTFCSVFIHSVIKTNGHSRVASAGETSPAIPKLLGEILRPLKQRRPTKFAPLRRTSPGFLDLRHPAE